MTEPAALSLVGPLTRPCVGIARRKGRPVNQTGNGMDPSRIKHRPNAFRFSLRSIFVATTALAVACAIQVRTRSLGLEISIGSVFILAIGYAGVLVTRDSANDRGRSPYGFLFGLLRLTSFLVSLAAMAGIYLGVFLIWSELKGWLVRL